MRGGEHQIEPTGQEFSQYERDTWIATIAGGVGALILGYSIERYGVGFPVEFARAGFDFVLHA